tara:strand:+ start:282 stop:2450 length:2169 start_codon:yes stop_codon:yes gene_type:complete
MISPYKVSSFFALLFMACFFQVSFGVSKPSKEEKTLLMADSVTHERNFDLLIARGNVEVEHSGDVLVADQVTYDKSLNRVTASGNVMLRSKEGDIVFAEFLELSDSLKEGTIREIRMILRDEAKLAAATARRQEGGTSIFDRAVYSPCKVCRATPEKDPLWQVKARRVVIDETAQDVIYTDAFLEMWGVPVLYSPYLSHPSPNVKRRSGFLAPTFGGDGSTGGFLAVPYYWVISEDKGLTVTPLYADSHPGLALDYDQRTRWGTLNLSGSGLTGRKDISVNHSSKFRGHFVGHGDFHLTPSWRAGFDVERASDQTYLRRLGYFGLNHRSSLVSRGGLEWFSERSHASIQGYSFQGLREGDRSAVTPVLLPMIDYSFLSRPGQWGESWTLDGNLLSLYRSEGASMQRASVTGGVSLPYQGRFGDVYTFGARLRGDAFFVNDFTPEGDASSLQGGEGLVFPQAYADWRYPFVRLSSGTRFLVEPRLGVVIAPHSGYSRKHPNEDNLFFEFNHLNLMDESRFAGLDRLDSGSRVNYGLGSSIFFESFGGEADLFLGQSFAFHEPRESLMGTGLENKWSDYVGRLSLSYQEWVEIKMRTLFNRASFKPRRNEITASIGQPIFKFSTDYILLPGATSDPLDRRGEQIQLTLDSQITDNWALKATTTRQLGNGSFALSHGIGAVYKDECFTFSTSLEKTFYRDRDIRPGVTLLFTIVFKNLGEVTQKL